MPLPENNTTTPSVQHATQSPASTAAGSVSSPAAVSPFARYDDERRPAMSWTEVKKLLPRLGRATLLQPWKCNECFDRGETWQSQLGCSGMFPCPKCRPRECRKAWGRLVANGMDRDQVEMDRRGNEIYLKGAIAPRTEE